MNAEIVAVGSEMLTSSKIDTNSLFLTGQLNSLGVEVVQKCIVGDDRERLTQIISAALMRSDIVILTGGLGPTEDDVTRDAVAAALGREQHFDQQICAVIEERFTRMKRRMAENNKRQAFVIEGAEVLPNDRGTAPGQWIETAGRIVMLLPGPPGEMKGMWEQQCHPRLTAKLPAQVIRTRFYRVAGMGESDLDQLIAPVYTRYANPACTVLAGLGDIQVHLRARCDTAEEAEALLTEVGGEIESLLGDRLYTSLGETLPERVGALLRSRNQTVCVAESCTGGLLGARLTDAAGSSDYFAGGFLAYTNDLKTRVLGVDTELIARESAVSEAVACAMASGARNVLKTDYGLSVTGIAGPDGGTEETPAGTVWIGLASEAGCEAKRVFFLGDRGRVRTMAAQTALDLLRRKLLAS